MYWQPTPDYFHASGYPEGFVSAKKDNLRGRHSKRRGHQLAVAAIHEGRCL
jgi:hypothetical protein